MIATARTPSRHAAVCTGARVGTSFAAGAVENTTPSTSVLISLLLDFGGESRKREAAAARDTVV